MQDVPFRNILHKNIMELSMTAPDNPQGVSVSEIAATLAGSYSEDEVREAIQFLSGEGHLYCTIDDEHFKCAQLGQEEF